jgi:hypothetical protein
MSLKKYKVLTFITLATTLFAHNQEPDRLQYGGSVGLETIEELTCTGVLKLNKTTIHKLDINGSLITTAASLSNILVRGEANLRESTISGACSIYGYLRAQDTTFTDPLTLGAHKAVFTASKLASITIEKEEGFKAKQIIELKQGTIVEGPIHFESGKGEVHSYSSKVLGPITGGKLIKK